MQIFTATANNNDFISFITPFLRNKSIIALDGMELTGKTKWFSSLIMQAAGSGKILHIDDYVRKQNKSFGLYILHSQKILLNDLQNQTNKPIILEGILIKEKLKSINVNPDLWIYLKRMADYGWLERDWLDKSFINEHGASSLNFHIRHPRLKQVYKYHMKYQPQENADIVIEVNENLYK